MKIFIGCLLVVCVLSVSIFIFGKSDTPIEVVRKYFELSRNQKFEEASALWSKDNALESRKSEITVKSVTANAEKFRYDISYAEEIYRSKYEIVDYREFIKSENTIVLCLSLKQDQRKLIFRVELLQNKGYWKIINMKDASEDALAVINNDCNTVNF